MEGSSSSGDDPSRRTSRRKKARVDYSESALAKEKVVSKESSKQEAGGAEVKDEGKEKKEEPEEEEEDDDEIQVCGASLTCSSPIVDVLIPPGRDPSGEAVSLRGSPLRVLLQGGEGRAHGAAGGADGTRGSSLSGARGGGEEAGITRIYGCIIIASMCQCITIIALLRAARPSTR